MTRMTPAKYVAANKNATGGDAATSSSTSGVHMPTPVKEDMMHKSTPARPWLDEATAKHLTGTDLARLDATYALWTVDYASSLGIDLVDYLRDSATDAAKIRMLIGPDEIPLPHFATINRFSEWVPTEGETDCSRDVTAHYVDQGGLNATLEAEQYAVSGRVDTRVHIEEGGTEDPAELTRWALDLLALAGRWTEIREGQA